MKKLLVVHNKYQFLGGEDIAVENEVKKEVLDDTNTDEFGNSISKK